MNDIERLIRSFSGVNCCLTALLDGKDCEMIRQALQEKAERENPKPLTLEQLKERIYHFPINVHKYLIKLSQDTGYSGATTS